MIKNWPKEERPRELVIDKGVQAVSDAGLVAILLRSGVKGKDVVSYSRGLIAEFGGLGNLLSAGIEELEKIKGLGPAKITQLLAAAEIGSRLLKQKRLEQKKITNSEDIVDYFSVLLKDKRVEYFNVVFLNRRNKVIEVKEMSKGTIDKASVYPREVIRRAITVDASSVIFIHNHPSGGTEPSTNDIAVTKKMIKAFETVEIDVLDHIIIAGNSYFSFKNNDLL